MCVHLFAKMNSSVQACGRFNNTYGMTLSTFLPPEKSFCTCAVNEISLTSWVVYKSSYLFQQSSAQLLPLTLSLKCLGETKLQFTPLNKFQLLCPEVCLLSSVQLLSRVLLFVTSWTAAHQASLSIINSQSPPKSMSVELMPSNHLILCRPLLLPPSIFPRISHTFHTVFSKESVLHIR